MGAKRAERRRSTPARRLELRRERVCAVVEETDHEIPDDDKHAASEHPRGKYAGRIFCGADRYFITMPN